MTEATELKTPEVGDVVKIVTEDYKDVFGLVTTVHGKAYEMNGSWWGPSINAVYVSPDASKHDPYGTQIERYSSLVHKTGALHMPHPGRYWDYADLADL